MVGHEENKFVNNIFRYKIWISFLCVRKKEYVYSQRSFHTHIENGSHLPQHFFAHIWQMRLHNGISLNRPTSISNGKMPSLNCDISDV